MPIDYSKAKIYCIRSPNTDLIYIGATCQLLSKRMSTHRSDSKSDSRPYTSSKVILECGEAYIELLENYPCSNKEELSKKEGEYIRSHNCCNKNIAGRTISEYYEVNKEVLAERKKQRYESNKEEILEQQKQYREANKDVVLERQKKYRESHKEVLAERQKQYYEANKEAILERNRQYKKTQTQNI